MAINKIDTTNSRLTTFSNWFMGLDKSDFEKISQGSKESDSADLGNPNYRPLNFNLTYFTLTELYPLSYLDAIRDFKSLLLSSILNGIVSTFNCIDSLSFKACSILCSIVIGIILLSILYCC